jgi:hypothetical protein
MMIERRKVEIFNGHTWETVSGLEAVREGTAYRMTEPNGTLVQFEGSTVLVAAEDGYMADGLGMVDGWLFPTDDEAIADAMERQQWKRNKEQTR